MFNRILLPTDFSEGAQRSLGVAKVLARRYGAEVHLVHVDEERALGMHSSDDLISFMNEVDSRRAEWMEGVASELQDEGFTVELGRLEGVASEQIVRYAADFDMDLVVMATLGHTTLKQLLLGSTVKSVLRHSPCPVLTVNARLFAEGDWSPTRVLFPTDFSAPSLGGLPVAAAVSRDFGAKLDLLHVLRAPTYIPAIPGEPPFYIPRQAFGAAKERSVADLGELAKRAILSGLTVDMDVVLAGDTADGIVTFADERKSDLVVIPRHGGGALRSMLFGRIAEHVVKNSRAPVLSFLPAGEPT